MHGVEQLHAPKFELETQSSVGACKVCLYIETDGRVSSATGACS